MCTPFLQGRGVEPPTKFSKKGGGLDRASTFRGGDFSQVGGGVATLTKNKWKSEIFNDKKVYKQKYFSLVTKN